MSRRAVFIVLATVGSCFPAPAQNNPRTKVVFQCQCNDPAAREYATALRDLLARSPRFIESSDSEEKDASGKVVHRNWKIDAVSIDPSANDDGERTVISVVILIGDEYMLTHIVQICSRAKSESAARYTLSALDDYIQKLGLK